MEGLQKEAHGSEEALQKEMLAEWEKKREIFEESVGEAESAEEIVGMLRAFGVRELREYNNGKKVVFHEEGASVAIDNIKDDVLAYAEAVRDGNAERQYALGDVGIPNVIKQRLQELYGKGERRKAA